VPGTTDRFLINPQGLHWSEVTAGDVVLSDAMGNVIEGRHPVEPTAFFIHARIHLGKPNAKVVLHTHMPYATALTAIEGGRLEMCSQNALRFQGRVAYDEAYNGLALDDSEGDRLCRAMGEADIAFLGNHGVIVSGPSIAMAFDELYYLERAAQLQVLAMSTGRKLSIVPTQIVQKTARQMAGESQQADYHFAALKRILDREEPGWSAL
jgi:ribulose-5-phosphate 4-epimerase/fuculose-1-phosphate aldolase